MRSRSSVTKWARPPRSRRLIVFLAFVRADSQFSLGEAEAKTRGLQPGQGNPSDGPTAPGAATSGVWRQQAPAERGPGEPCQAKLKPGREARV